MTKHDVILGTLLIFIFCINVLGLYYGLITKDYGMTLMSLGIMGLVGLDFKRNFL